jgi:hypothetical protein
MRRHVNDSGGSMQRIQQVVGHSKGEEEDFAGIPD